MTLVGLSSLTLVGLRGSFDRSRAGSHDGESVAKVRLGEECNIYLLEI
jgi:hypothetical protein